MHAGQYIQYCSQTPSKLETSWIKALYHRAHKICSNKQALDKQISQIKMFMSWNGYPKWVRNSIVKRIGTNKSHSRLTDDNDRKKIWLDLPYNGKLGEKLVTFLIKKLKCYFKEKVNINVKYRTNKLCFVQRKIEKVGTKKQMLYTLFNALVVTMIVCMYVCMYIFRRLK